MGFNQVIQLERDGRFREIAALGADGEVLRVGSARDLAALARAHAFLGEKSEANRWIEALRVRPSGSADDERAKELRLALTHARFYRDEGRWQASLELLDRCLELAQDADVALLGEIRFAQAICFVETGRPFLGLDLLSALRADTSQTEYRRNLTSLNEAWLLWDLGQAEEMESLLPILPLAYRMRAELCLALMRADFSFAEKILAARPDTGIESEIFQIAHLLVEAIAVQPELLARDQWVRAYFQEALSQNYNAGKSAIVRTCLSILDNEAILAPQAVPGILWREALTLGFLQWLQIARSQSAGEPLQEKEHWDRYVEPILKQVHFRSPLIPSRRAERWSPASAWSARLSKLCGASPEATPAVKLRLCTAKREVTFGMDPTQKLKISLEKSPVSFKLLRILAGRKGRAISFRQIHENLTPARYSSFLHDGRVQKLLIRLHQRLVHLPEPAWILPGDRSVVLCVDIECAQ